MAENLTIQNITDQINDILSLNTSTPQEIPTPLVLLSQKRAGLSVKKIFAEVLKAKQELGLVVGTLPNGNPNLDDIMLYLTIEKIIDALKYDSNIKVTIEPGGQLKAAGTAGVIPCAVTGIITDFQTGGAIIQ